MPNNRNVNPKIERHFFLGLRDELFALANFSRHQWYFVFVVALAALLLIYYQNPLPPKTIRVAVGQENSTLEVTAKMYLPFFRETHTKVEFVRTRGAIENLDLLKQGKVDVALSQGGAPLGNDKGIVSLGSVGYQPLWFFYRDTLHADTDIFSFLEGRKFSIGLQGSGTRIVVDALLKVIPKNVTRNYGLIELPAGESIKALTDGKIDGMFLLAGLESGNTQALLASKGVRALSFRFADAMTRQLDYTEVVSVPPGGVSLSPIMPHEAIQMIATTTTILVREDLHPAIQHTFLKAAMALSQNTPGFFVRKGGFPAFVDRAAPKSKVAERFLKNGSVMFEDYIPFWLASYFDVAWFWMLTAIAVIYPLRSFVPHYRVTLFEVVLSQIYREIFQLYFQAGQAISPGEYAGLAQKFDKLYDRVCAVWVPEGCNETYGFLLGALELLHTQLLAHQPQKPTQNVNVQL
jgi:TRAP-type uncharacterized transport system substrate-binding protein